MWDSWSGSCKLTTDSTDSKMYLSSYTSCVFCVEDCSPTYSFFNGQFRKSKHESETEQAHIFKNTPTGSTSNTEELNSIRKNLEVIFILREIFDYPTEKCLSYLSENGGSMHPEHWFTVCTTCRACIQDCYHIRRKVTQLETQIVSIKSKLRQSIFSSAKPKLKSTRRKLTNVNHQPENIWNDLRNHVLQDSRQNEENGEKSRYVPGAVKTTFDCGPVFSDELGEGAHHNSCESDRSSTPSSITTSDLDWCPDADLIKPNEEIAIKVNPKVQKLKLKRKKKQLISSPSRSRILKRNKTCQLAKRNAADTSSKSINIHDISRDEFEEDMKVIEDKVKPESHLSNPDCKSMEMEQRKKVRKNKIYVCDVCPSKFLSARRLHNHKHLIHAKSTDSAAGFKCPECDKAFDVLYKLPRHLNNMHRSEGKHSNFKWVATESLEVKKVMDKTGIPFYCDHCDGILPNEIRLIKHVKDHHQERKDAACQYCTEKYGSKQLLQFHLEIYHPHVPEVANSIHPKTEEIPQSCSHCSETFLTKMKLDYHIAKFHPNACSKCSFVGFKYAILKKHLITVHKIGEKMFICELCSKTYLEKYGLRQHMQVEHYKELGLTPFKCTICDAVVSTELLLKTHVESVHNKVKKHFCEFCGKGFAYAGDLTRHVLLHTAPREEQYKKGPFFCQFCNAKFNVRQGLYYHLKKKHNDKFLFRCGNCGKGYCSSNTLEQHKKSCMK